MDGLRVHLCGIKLIVVSALSLGAIKRGAGISQDRSHVLTVRRKQADTDAGGDKNLLFANLKRLAEGIANRHGSLHQIVAFADLAEQQRKLFAVKMRNGIAFPNAVVQPGSGFG